MKALKFCIIVAWLIALAVFAYSWISEPDKISEESNEALVIGHKPIVIPSDVKTNEIYTVDTEPFIQTFTKTNEIDFGTSTVYVLNVINLTKDYTNLFQLQIDGVPIVTVKPNGDVIYDTNNVSEATRIFWREMTYQARKVTERIGK